MAEWLLVVLAIVGIVLLGFFFSALDFFKGLTRFLMFGLFVFLLFLLANRFLPTIESNQSYGDGYPPGENFRTPRLDPNSDASRYLRNLGEDIDEFVFGPPESYPDSTASGTASPGAAPSRDLVYPVPSYGQDPGTVAEQPTSRSSQSQNSLTQPSASQTTRQSANQSQSAQPTTDRRPVSAMW